MSKKPRCAFCGQELPAPRTFGEAVNWDRVRRKMTMREYGRMTGMAASTISRVERGMQPSLSDFYFLCKTARLDSVRYLRELVPDGALAALEKARGR